jgi:sulfoxide reductase heme-binding subunit YedZ
VRDGYASVHLIAGTAAFLSYGLLWIGTLWGVVLKNGWGFTRVRHTTIYGVHMVVTLLGLTLGVVHALAQVAPHAGGHPHPGHPGGPVQLINVVIPFTYPVNPIGIGVGVIALELFIALIVSVLVQRRLGYHRWQQLHRLGYVAYALVTAHMIMSGSDMGSLPARLLAVSTLVILLAAASATAVRNGALRRSRTVAATGRSDVVLNVDPSRCVRYGFCAHEAPELFRLRTDGRLDYRAAVPPEQVEQALRAAQVCPVRAVMLGRRPTAVVMAGEGTRPNPESDRPDLRPVSGGRMER